MFSNQFDYYSLGFAETLKEYFADNSLSSLRYWGMRVFYIKWS